MKIQHIAALLVAASAVLATPAFASGYGPAPFYHSLAGAPASQRGPSVQTLAASSTDMADAQHAYGGVVSGHSESAGRFVAASARNNLFAHH